MKLSLKVSPGLQNILKQGRNFERRFLGKLNVAAKTTEKVILDTLQNVYQYEDFPPNEENYLNWKRKHGFDTIRLFRTHLLFNSISQRRVNFSLSLIKGQTGWRKGARYGGILQDKIYTGRVPSFRKRFHGAEMGAMRNRMYEKGGRAFDVEFLANVAYWNERGYGERPPRPFMSITYEKLTSNNSIPHIWYLALAKSFAGSEVPF